MITFTYPHIGNYGVNADDDESRRAVLPRRRRARPRPPPEQLARDRRPRRLPRRATASPASPASTPAGSPATSATRGAMPGAFGTDEAAVRCRGRAGRRRHRRHRPRRRPSPPTAPYTVGDRRRAVLRRRVRLRHQAHDPRATSSRAGCQVEVVPASTPAADVLAREPDGVFLSNGPGDPAAVAGAAETVRGLLGEVPVFGICLGHQILGPRARRRAPSSCRSATTAATTRCATSRPAGSRSRARTTTTRSTPTRCPDGVERHAREPERRRRRGHARRAACRAFSVQYHPEAGPGPHDAALPVRRVHRR